MLTYLFLKNDIQEHHPLNIYKQEELDRAII